MSKNIILIGAPDCGKTTIGNILSKELGLKFLNTNEDVEDKRGHSITEDQLRILVNEAVHKLSEMKSSIISTGVEVLKNISNIKKLKENAIVIFIDKPTEDETHSSCEGYDILRKCCDLHLVNDNNADEIVRYINSIYC